MRVSDENGGRCPDGELAIEGFNGLSFEGTWKVYCGLLAALALGCQPARESPSGAGATDAGGRRADAGISDAGVADASDGGAEVADAGERDAGAGVIDGGSADAGVADAGAADAGAADAGEADAGTASGGAPDAGDAPPTLSAAELAALQTLSPATLPTAPPDVSNRFADDPQAAALGQELFFETGFSGALLDSDNDGGVNTLGQQGQTGRVACASCHIPSAGFLDDRSKGEQVSLASGWDLRRTPSLLDIGQSKLLMWDGRHDALYNQPFGPFESPVEMNSSRLYIAEQAYTLYQSEYEAIFGAMPPLDDTSRFPALSAALTGCQPASNSGHPTATCTGTEHGLPGDGAEYDHLAPADQTAVTQVVVNLGKALGAYERLITCGPSRFDQWMHGDPTALSNDEQRGAQIFVSSGQCIQCHSGPFFSDEEFHDVGLQPATVAEVFIDTGDPGAQQGLALDIADPLNTRGQFSDGDDGRLPESVPAGMNGSFRTPKLRCAALRPSFMHTGQLSTLAQTVAFFSSGGDTSGYLGTNELTPLSLSAEDQEYLTAFLNALEGPGPAANLLSP